MVKLRQAYYCNLKLMLLYLVVLGHWIEGLAGFEHLYRLIYRFHMPLFVFLSGLFVRTKKDCLGSIRRLGPVYLLCQGVCLLLGLAPWHTPWWILWYLLSLLCWLAAAIPLLKLGRFKWVALLPAFAAGCLVGLTGAGRVFSLSRTVVFFPWFWLGVCLEPELPWHRLRPVSPIFLLLGLMTAPRIPAALLYHAGPCDPSIRLGCYLSALGLGLFLLAWCPRRRLPFSFAGADTLPGYLLHGPVVRILGPVEHPAIAAAVFLYLISKAARWHRCFGVTGKEGRPWPDLKTSTRPTGGPSTGSSCP